MKNINWKTPLAVIAVLLMAFFCVVSPTYAQDEEAAPVDVADATAAGKPILLMGAKYGQHDRQTIREEILIPRKLTYEDGGDWVSAENWKNYSLVIVANAIPAEMGDAEEGWIRDYLTGGGRLLLLGPVLSQLRQKNNAPLDWLGAGGYQVAKDGAYEVAEAGKKYFGESAAVQTTLGAVGMSGPTKFSTAQVLLSRGGDAVGFRNTFGKGEVFSLGFDYFRVGMDKPTKERPAVRAAIRAVLEKILISGDTQTTTDQIAAGLKAYQGTSKEIQPIVWRRDFANARGAEYAVPPFPKKGDELKTIHLDVGVGESESFPVYLSSATAQPDFSMRIDDLKNQDAGGIAHESGQNVLPASSLRVRTQGLAKPTLTVGPFWLLDLTQEKGARSSTWKMPLEANHSATFWVTFSTLGLAPGHYSGQVQFQNPSLPAVVLDIQIWPVALPGREYFAAEATSMWSSLLSAPGESTYNFPNPPTRLDLFDKHVQDIAAHDISFNSDASWTDRFGHSISLKNVRLRESGVSFETAIQQGLVKETQLPALDFSYFDPFIETPLLNGIPYFHFNFKNLPTDWLGYAKDITRDPNLAPDSERHLAIKRWLLTQIVEYLHSKGITKIVAFVADEIPPDKIDDAVRRAKLLRECGLQTEFTATGITGQTRQYIEQMNPAIDRWIWNASVLPKAKALVRSDHSPIDRTDEEYTYVADWHRAPYVFNRVRGPFCSDNDLDGLMVHGYLRWYPNGGAVFNSLNGPIDTEGWEGARDGIEDARYENRLKFLLRAASQKPELAADVKRIQGRMAKWVATTPDAYVRLEEHQRGIYVFNEPVSTYDALQKYKSELLESLVELQSKIPTTISMRYANLAIVTKGELVARLEGDANAISGFKAALAERTGTNFKVATDTNAARLIFSSVAETAPEILKSVGKPLAGSYKIAVADSKVLVIGDAAGLQKGAKILSVLLESSETVI